MEKINQIPSVYSFCVNDHLLVINREDHSTIALMSLKGIAKMNYSSAIYLSNINTLNNMLWCNSSNDVKSVFFDGFNFHEKNFHINDIDLYQDQLLVTHKKNQKKIVQNMTLMTICSGRSMTGYLIILWMKKKIFYAKNKNEIIFIDNHSGKKNWNFLIEEKYNWTVVQYNGDVINKQATINKILGVFNNILWVLLSSNKILGINIDSGKEEKYFMAPDVFSNRWNEEEATKISPFGHNTVLDLKTGEIYSVYYQQYGVIDLNEMTYSLYSIKESTEEYAMKIYNSNAVAGDNIFIHEDLDSNHFGIFNKKIKKIIWSKKLEDQNGKSLGIRRISYAQNKLFIHDRYNTLHIYEDVDSIT